MANIVDFQGKLVLACVPLAVLVIWLSKWIGTRRGSNVKRIPRVPGGHWLWGNEREIFDHAAGEKFSEWFEKMGWVVRYKGAWLHPDILAIADPRAIHHILTEKTYNFVKSPFLRPLIERLVGRGLVWAERTQHKQQRKLLNPAFSAASIRNMAEDVADCTANLRNKLQSFVQSNGDDVVLDITHWTSAVTLDVIGRVGFDYDFQFGESPDAKSIQNAWKEQVNLSMSRSAFVAQIFLRTFPFLLNIPVKAIQAQGATKSTCARISKKLIEQGRFQEKGRTLLSHMLNSRSSESTQLSFTQIIDNVSTFIIVGHETTAASLAMILLELARNIKVQDRLRTELAQLGREPTYEDLTNPAILPYLDAVLKEGLRMHPSGPYIDRVALQDDVIPLSRPIRTLDGKELTELRIRAGQFIQLPIVSINRVNDVWKDGSTFRPERWLEENGLPARSLMQNGWSNTMSFSEGPRICIGYRLAVLEMKSIVAMLIHNFTLHDTPARIETKVSTTLQTRVVGREGEGAQLPLRVKPVLH